MKILHTADIHLKEYEDERWMGLRRLIEIGNEADIAIFVISGDLFDKGIDAENLRPKIRELFSDTGFKIVLIPGNHDMDSYRGGMYFGEDTIILTDVNSPFEYKDVKIVGIPFEPIEGEQILNKLHSLANYLTTDTKNILLYHGELLDAFFSRRDFGDEGEDRYMPVKLSYFEGLNVDYVLAGHFHTSFDVRSLENGGYFVYPGSPLSITKREIGQRKVNIFEVGKPPQEYLLDTPHFEEIRIELDPFTGQSPVETIREKFGTLHKEAKIILTVKGFINSKALGMSETEIARKIEQVISDKCIEKRLEFRDIHVILEDDLFQGFLRKLEQTDYDGEQKRELIEMTIKAMTEAGL